MLENILDRETFKITNGSKDFNSIQKKTLKKLMFFLVWAKTVEILNFKHFKHKSKNTTHFQDFDFRMTNNI